YSLVDLPEGMPREVFNDLKRTRVAGQQLRISVVEKNSKPGMKSAKPGNQRKSAGKGRSKSTPGPKKSGKKKARKK
ncbi:MAG TPA: ATP-dependent RNA helicase, partial [Gammaproteobacteria bacterium]|nr:ATP-dependent RNA helicase [Gammaproteobacteria bacterium]